MHFKRHAVPMLALAAAISGEVHAQVVANDDALTLAAGQVSVITLQALLANDQRLDDNGGPLPLDRIFVDTTAIGGSESQYVDANGQPADPFASNSPEGFVILCPFSPDNGSLIINESGQLEFTPATDEEGEDSFDYGLQEYQFTGDGYVGVDDDFASANISLRAQAAEGLAALVQGRNRQQVARSLDRLCNGDPGSMSADLAARCSELLALAAARPEQIDGIVAQITPEEALALRRLASDVVRHQSDLIFRQQQARRLQESAADVALGGNVLELLNYQGGNAGEAGAGRWSSFVSVRQDETEASETDLEAAYDMDTTAMTLGADYRLNADWVLGTALGWARQDLAFGADAGDITSDTFNLIAYLSWAAGPLNLDAQFGYGNGDYDITRLIRYESINTAAEGSTESELYTLNTQLDWNWQRQALGLRPYLRLDYLHALVDGYEEQGGEGWAIAVGDQDMDQLTASVGLDTTYALSFGWGVLVPGLNLAALSQSSDDYSPVAFHFLGDGSGSGDFVLTSEGEDSLFYQYEVNLVAVLTRGGSLFFSYRGNAEQDNTDSQQINLGGRLEF